MIAFLPLWILGVPLVLALIDLMATRSGAHDVDHDDPAPRHTGVHREFRRGGESAPIATRAVRHDAPANVS